MKISSSTIAELAGIIIENPYRSGPILVELFNEFFINKDTYGSGFPSRLNYAKQKINKLNGSKELRLLIEEVFHLCHFKQELANLRTPDLIGGEFNSKDFG